MENLELTNNYRMIYELNENFNEKLNCSELLKEFVDLNEDDYFVPGCSHWVDEKEQDVIMVAFEYKYRTTLKPLIILKTWDSKSYHLGLEMRIKDCDITDEMIETNHLIISNFLKNNFKSLDLDIKNGESLETYFSKKHFISEKEKVNIEKSILAFEERINKYNMDEAEKKVRTNHFMDSIKKQNGNTFVIRKDYLVQKEIIKEELLEILEKLKKVK